MNIWECDILNCIFSTPFLTQRALAEATGYSLGLVNQSIQALVRGGYLDKQMGLTEKATQEFSNKAPRNAIILAAGYGMRMVPINMDTPKGLLEVNGEPLIERIIRQLQEAGIQRISIVVGFMKEQYEYLMDLYGVELIVNPEYPTKNNLHSLKLAVEHLSNTYVVPCDIWCNKNPFQKHELYSWYMVSDLAATESTVRVNRKKQLVSDSSQSGGNAMIGIAYLLESESAVVREKILQLSQSAHYNKAFWEEVLFQNNKMIVAAKVVSSAHVVEIDTYEQLHELDFSSKQLNTSAISAIADALQVSPKNISNITVLKKGMTNRSFLFTVNGERYIMRIPGEGTGQIINRKEEATVYAAIQGKGICDDLLFIEPSTGFKITRFLEGSRVCDPENPSDVTKCINLLREFHKLELTVEHEFDMFKQIDFYESLWNGVPSAFKDYKQTRDNVFALRPYVEKHTEQRILTHIDAVPDNFLFVTTPDGQESLQLIDWEYAGMQDPHVDIAMFCIYAMYSKLQVDQLIDAYFFEGCPDTIRRKIYCYIAICGLLWSNWCEYKRTLGAEFSEYSLRQYRYAKDYYKIVQEDLKKGFSQC